MINKLCLLLLISIQPAIAQQQQQAALPAIPKDGFYNIVLTPDIVAACTDKRLADVRIYEGIPKPMLDAMSEVPYILRQESKGYDRQSFREFPMLENKQVIKGTSTLVFSNEAGLKLDHFEIIVKNTWVKKKISISGSDDKKNWYALTNEKYFNPETATTDSSGTVLIGTIDIPVTAYRYYRLLINDSATAPLNFIKLGLYDIITEEANYLPIPSPVITTGPTIKLQFGAAYLINKIAFTVTTPALYHRQVTLCTLNGNHFIPVQQFTLITGQPTQVVLDNGVKGKEFYLVVENDDNRPLQISAVNAWQANVYLTAYLEKGKSYIIKAGDTTLQLPRYDLSYFTDSLSGNIPVLHAGKLTQSASPGKVPEVITTFFRNMYWIWGGIVGITILIGILVSLMFREMERKKKQ
jgi:hypothetical protein